MAFDYITSRADADEMVHYFGMAAVLRRATDTPTDRPCWVVIIDELPKEQAAQLTNPTDRKVILSPIGLDDEPPDDQLDSLVTFFQPPTTLPVEKEVLPFTSPLKKTAPAGITVLYEGTVRR